MGNDEIRQVGGTFPMPQKLNGSFIHLTRHTTNNAELDFSAS